MRIVIFGLLGFILGSTSLFSTSISEQSDYPAFCEQAAQDDDVFTTFKSSPKYVVVPEK